MVELFYGSVLNFFIAGPIMQIEAGKIHILNWISCFKECENLLVFRQFFRLLRVFLTIVFLLKFK